MKPSLKGAVLGLALLQIGCAAQKPLPIAGIGASLEPVATGGPTISLITVSPGAELFSAHGHTALEVDEDGDPSTPNVVYNYGGFTMEQIFGNPERGLVTLLTENVTGLRARYGGRDGGGHSYSDFYNAYLGDPSVERVVRKDRLLLTEAQTRALIDRLAQEWRDAGEAYPYKNYSDNCTTRIRDHLFRTVGGEALVSEIRSFGNDRTYEALSIEEMDVGARAELKTRQLGASGEIIVVPARQRRRVKIALTMIGLRLPMTVASGEEFYGAIRALYDDLSKSPLANDPFFKASRALEQFRSQIERLSSVPDAYDALFLPAVLRRTLAGGRVINPATGLPLIDEANAVISVSALPPPPSSQQQVDLQMGRALPASER